MAAADSPSPHYEADEHLPFRATIRHTSTCATRTATASYANRAGHLAGQLPQTPS